MQEIPVSKKKKKFRSETPRMGRMEQGDFQREAAKGLASSAKAVEDAGRFANKGRRGEDVSDNR